MFWNTIKGRRGVSEGHSNIQFTSGINKVLSYPSRPHKILLPRHFRDDRESLMSMHTTHSTFCWWIMALVCVWEREGKHTKRKIHHHSSSSLLTCFLFLSSPLPSTSSPAHPPGTSSVRARPLRTRWWTWRWWWPTFRSCARCWRRTKITNLSSGLCWCWSHCHYFAR